MCKRNLVLFLLLAFSFLGVHQMTAEEYRPISLTELSRLTTIYQDCKDSKQTALATLKQSQIQASELQTLSTQLSANLAKEREQIASLQESYSKYKAGSQSTISSQSTTIAQQEIKILEIKSQRNKLFVGLIGLVLLIVGYVFIKLKF